MNQILFFVFLIAAMPGNIDHVKTFSNSFALTKLARFNIELLAESIEDREFRISNGYNVNPTTVPAERYPFVVSVTYENDQ